MQQGAHYSRDQKLGVHSHPHHVRLEYCRLFKLWDEDGLAELWRAVHAIYDYISRAETKFLDAGSVYPQAFETALIADAAIVEAIYPQNPGAFAIVARGPIEPILRP